MKRITLILSLFLLTAMGVVFVATNSADAGSGCTKTGTSGKDVLAGGPVRDILCGIGGKDYIHGDGGNDVLRGGSGPDSLVTSKGFDVAKGNGGRDRIFTVDGVSGDRAIGGPGLDRCYVDAGDIRKGCESVFISFSKEQTAALEQASLFVARIAEDATSPTPTPTPAPTTTPPPPGTGTTVTITVTVTASPPARSPQCTPPPATAPPNCSGV